MPRRPRSLLTALVLVLVLVGLAGCGEPDAPEETEDPVPLITVSGAFGRVPVASFDIPLALAEASSEVFIEGDGRALSADGPALLSLTGYSGDTGDLLTDRRAAQARTVLLTPEEVGEEVYPVLLGVTEGSRVLLTQPVADGEDDGESESAGEGEGDGENGSEAAGEGEGEEMLVLIIDVLHSRAEGEVLDPREGFPDITIDEDDDGVPTVSPPDDDPPETLEVSTVIRGEGRQVSPGQSLTLQYVTVVWPGGEIYDSTWAAGQVPRTVDIDDTFTGLRDGLLDQTVGSRVAIVVPPALGTGDETLVFLVDILAVADGEETGTPDVVPTTPAVEPTTPAVSPSGTPGAG